MQGRWRRWFAGLCVVGGLALSGAVRVAPIVGLGLLPACGPDCTPRSCNDLGSGSNGKSFNSCGTCDDYGCDLNLKDEDGNSFYECTDNDGKTCSNDPGFLSAEETYCDL